MPIPSRLTQFPFSEFHSILGMHLVAGDFAGHSVVHKFGENDNVGTSMVPVAHGGLYPTPQVSGATTLRIKAGNAADTAGGAGARELTLEGVDETGAFATETLATNGTSAGTAGSITFLRLYRAWVSASGTYATSSSGSHVGDITIENGSGGTDWSIISVNGFAESQTNTAAYTVPLGMTAYIPSFSVTTDASKSTDILLFKRENILETAAPYTAMRTLFHTTGVSGTQALHPETPMGPFPALTDIGFMAELSTGTGAVSVDFEIILMEDT